MTSGEMLKIVAAIGRDIESRVALPVSALTHIDANRLEPPRRPGDPHDRLT
jgi:hypothetical protein